MMIQAQAIPNIPEYFHVHQGTLAEHMVAADLMKQGYPCYFSAAGLKYDLVVDVAGTLYRIQVKSTESFRRRHDGERLKTYIFHIKTSGAFKYTIYKTSDFDILALVVIDGGYIAYLDSSHAPKKTIQLRPPGSPKHSRRKTDYNIDELPFSKVVESFRKAKR